MSWKKELLKLNIIKEKIEKHKFLSLFLFVLVLNIVLFLWAKSNWTFYYTMNDDIRMKSILSGELSGIPDGHVLFIRYMLTAPLSLLYSLMPAISWYNIMLVGTIFISLVTICYRIFRINMSYKKIAFNTIVYTAFFIIFVLKNVIYPQFTVTAGFASMSVVVILLTCRKIRSTKTFLIDLLLIILFTYLGVTIRSNVFYMIIVFAAVPLCIDFIKYREGLKKILVSAGIIVSIVGVVQLVESNAYSSTEYSEYKAYNRARALVYDYLQFPDFNTNYEFYEEHHVDTVVYDLLKEYSIRLDARITTDFLLDMQQYQNERFPKDKDKLMNLPMDMYENTFTNTYTTIIVYSFLLMSLYAFVMFLCKKHYIFLFHNVCFFGMVVAEIAYFVFTNRFPERVMVPLLMTATLSQYILCSFVWKKHGISPIFRLKKDVLSGLKIVIGCAILSSFAGMSFQSIDDMRVEKERSTAETAYIDYAQQHPDNYYYNDAEFFTGRLNVTFMENTTELRNFMPDGGWGSGHPLLRDNLQAFSLTSMEDALLKGNVYFLSRRPVHYIENYYAYKGKIVVGSVVDTIPDTEINVYHFEEKAVIETYDEPHTFENTFSFHDDELEERDSEVAGIMLEVVLQQEGTLRVSLEGQNAVNRVLNKGKNYVFYPYRKNDIINLSLDNEAKAEIEKIVVY